MIEYPCFWKNLKEYGNETIWGYYDCSEEDLENCKDCVGEENLCKDFRGNKGMEDVIKEIILYN